MDVIFDERKLQRAVNVLGNFARRGIPHATRNGLNASAFEGRKAWTKEVEKAFTLRNTFTTRSLRVQKARGIDMRKMHSVLGSTADYMAEQETGGTERKSGKHGVPIPTPTSSGEGRAAKRLRPVRRPNWLPKISLANRGSQTGMHRQQRNAVAIRKARKAGRKYVLLELEKRVGIFRLSGGKRRPKVDMVWDLSQPTVKTKPARTLRQTLWLITPTLPRLHVRAILEQLRRAGIRGF